MKYLISQYELHLQTYRVEADSRAQAVLNLLNGKGDLVGCPEYVGVCNDSGIIVDDLSDIDADKLDHTSLLDHVGFVNSIADIELEN